MHNAIIVRSLVQNNLPFVFIYFPSPARAETLISFRTYGSPVFDRGDPTHSAFDIMNKICRRCFRYPASISKNLPIYSETYAFFRRHILPVSLVSTPIGILTKLIVLRTQSFVNRLKEKKCEKFIILK